MTRTPQDLTKMQAEIDRIRLREEKRLISIAQKLGYFDRAIKTPELVALLKDALAKHPVKHSQLRKLEDRMTQAKRKNATEERRLDARRKILLGAFLMAQVDHRPEEFGWVARELEKFLDSHDNKDVAASNKAVLADWLKQS